jgi:hypothetical protein
MIRSIILLSVSSSLAVLFFSWAKKELPAVALFHPEKIQASFARLSTAIRARV